MLRYTEAKRFAHSCSRTKRIGMSSALGRKVLLHDAAKNKMESLASK